MTEALISRGQMVTGVTVKRKEQTLRGPPVRPLAGGSSEKVGLIAETSAQRLFSPSISQDGLLSWAQEVRNHHLHPNYKGQAQAHLLGLHSHTPTEPTDVSQRHSPIWIDLQSFSKETSSRPAGQSQLAGGHGDSVSGLQPCQLP